jgi:hypothetical protein
VGTWTLVSVVTEIDGREFDAYSPNAKGLLVFDANGRYSIVFIAGGLPNFASGNRSSATADESKAVVAGSLAHFGSYIVDEVDKNFTFQIDRATFPNWDGRHNKRAFFIRGDKLHFTDPHASGGWSGDNRLRARKARTLSHPFCRYRDLLDASANCYAVRRSRSKKQRKAAPCPNAKCRLCRAMSELRGKAKTYAHTKFFSLRP